MVCVLFLVLSHNLICKSNISETEERNADNILTLSINNESCMRLKVTCEKCVVQGYVGKMCGSRLREKMCGSRLHVENV